MRIPTPREVGRLLEGEAAAQQVGDMHFLRRQIVVARQVQRARGTALEIRHSKYGSERVVRIPRGW